MIVLYRKYRPQKIAELDSLDIQKKLGAMLSSKSIPHAFLFTGPRGLGKTSSARIIAKSVNCLANDGRGEPCGICDICRSITEGTNVDVLEIDAASNRGIDDIRDLREKVRLLPTRARYKVYIIDEVHMLTTEAFNALLKTLEEPPAHALFILCTTEPGKLPETIVSRCIRFDFKKATEKEIVSSLKRVVKGEKLDVEEDALPLLIRLSDGSFRDAHKAIEQLAMSAKKITKELVEEVFNLSEAYRNKDFLVHLAKRDSRSAILWFDDAVEKGMDIRMFHESLLSTFRKYLLKKVSDIGPSVNEDAYDLFSIDDLKKLIDMTSRATLDLRVAIIPQLPLELVILEWCGNEGESQGSASGSPKPIVSKEDSEREEEPSERAPSVKKREVGEDDSQADVTSLTDLEEINTKWDQVLNGVRPLNHSVQALLRGCRPLGRNGKFLILEAFYKFHKEKLEEQKSRDVLEKVLQDVFGEPMLVKCVLGERLRKKEETKNTNQVPGEKNEQGDDTLKEAEKIFGAKTE